MHRKILKILKETEDYVSGEELGEQLGVSRTSIWKGIKKLRQEGYDIRAVSNRGYFLQQSETMFNAQEILDGLQTDFVGQEVYFYEETDSTNLCIRKLAAQGVPEGTLAVAEVQNQGRGRLGKPWSSQKGVGIWMSLLLFPEIPPNQAPLLTLLTGLAVCRGIRNETGLPAEIKWPNDIFIHGKKVCGILTELEAEMLQVHYVVIGIGINVNTEHFPKELQDIATSLKIENDGEEVSRKKLVQAILTEFEGLYQQYLQEGTFNSFLEEYKDVCMTIGQEVRVLGKHSFEGTAIGINPQGELIVRKEDGSEVVVFSGEVSIRPKERSV